MNREFGRINVKFSAGASNPTFMVNALTYSEKLRDPRWQQKRVRILSWIPSAKSALAFSSLRFSGCGALLLSSAQTQLLRWAQGLYKPLDIVNYFDVAALTNRLEKRYSAALQKDNRAARRPVYPSCLSSWRLVVQWTNHQGERCPRVKGSPVDCID